MNGLAVDVGGTNVKILVSGQKEPRKFPSGPKLTPERMVSGVKELAADWKYDVVSIGYPGRVVGDRAVTEPHNLAHGWVGFDFAAAFGRPVKVINDAAMQALGSYNGGTMLFLGLGTGLGDNAYAFLGGFRMWEKSGGQQPSPRPGTRNDRKTPKGARP